MLVRTPTAPQLGRFPASCTDWTLDRCEAPAESYCMVSSGVGGNPIIIQGPPISPGPPKLAVLVYGARETEFRYQRTMKFDLNSRQLKTLN